MKFYKYIVALQILNLFNSVTGQWCFQRKYVTKTRIQWNNGERLISKRTFFGNIKYHYEPYLFSSLEYYNDYESVAICCDGYRKINETFCQPLCRPSCPANSQCTRPNICECDEGYAGYSGRPATVKCQPVCRPGCSENAYCSPGNKCNCKEGYMKLNSTYCEPICEDKCPNNSVCIMPNTCRCNKGWHMNGSRSLSTCEPECSETCPENAICTAPDTCLCSKGYELGKTETNTSVCVPKCVDVCPDHSFCSRPNYCECKSGYKKSFYGICEPVCDEACPAHASCTAPNNCTCTKGYKMINNLCQPICDKPCPEHGNCLEPNKCQCSDGYLMKFSSTYNPYCEPQCQPNCSTFGKCIQPNKCECLEGYEMDEMEICQPICSKGCLNGLCFSPEVCICNPGFLMGPNGQCDSVCSMPCENAFCVEPEICQCFKGYVMKKSSVSVCEPQCQPECINGVCIDANVCICNENYEPMPTIDGGLSHSNCQQIASTPFPTAAITDDDSHVTIADENFATTKASEEFSRYSIFENTEASSTLTPLVNSDVCIDRCQCWEEFDILGPLSAVPQCVHICLDAYDKPCLNVSQCKCDSSNMHLHCQEEGNSEEDDEDTLMYMCKVLKQQEIHKDTTNHKTIDGNNAGYKIDNHSGQAVDMWVILASIIGVCSIAALLVGLYFKCRGYEDPIIEYEM